MAANMSKLNKLKNLTVLYRTDTHQVYISLVDFKPLT